MAMRNPRLREPTFESVIVDEEIGPIEVVAYEHGPRKGRFAIDSFRTTHEPSGSAGGGRVPQTAIARSLVALFCRVHAPNRVVGPRQREEVQFRRAVPPRCQRQWRKSWTLRTPPLVIGVSNLVVKALEMEEPMVVDVVTNIMPRAPQRWLA